MSDTIYEKNGAQLTVKPRGRLDTATSPVLEKELKVQLDGVQDLIMDFEEVDYISSGGLRVLLTTQQAMDDCGGTMKLIHVNDYIIDVFDLVGFMDIIHVERG